MMEQVKMTAHDGKNDKIGEQLVHEVSEERISDCSLLRTMLGVQLQTVNRQ
jgi:hypothetical protein